MPIIFTSSSIAKRTRLQRQLLAQEFCASSRGQSESNSKQGFDDYGIKKKKASKTVNQNGSSSLGRRLDQPIRIDDYDEEQDYENGSGCSLRSKARLKKSIELDESSLDESEEEESESDPEESDGEEEIGDIEFPNIAMESNGYGSASSFKTGTHTYFVYSSDDSDSDDTIVVSDEKEDADEDFPRFCKDHERKQNDTNTCFYDQSTEDDAAEPSSSSESESDNSENWDFLRNKRLNQPTSYMHTGLRQPTEHNEPSTSIQSESENSHGSDFLPSIEKPNRQPTKNINNHSVRKAISKKTDKKPMDCSSDTDTNGRMSAEHIANGVKHRERKRRRVPRKENGGSVDAILDSIVGNGEVDGKEGDDDDDGVRVLPLRFRFDDSEDESMSRETDDSDVQRLFQEMNFEFECEEIGSYKNPMVENGDNDDSNGADIKLTPSELCQRGEHGDIYLEEQTGMRCRLCGAVILESRYVIPKLATYAPDRSKRSNLFSEQRFSSSENVYHEASDWNVCEKTKGTFWELIPARIRAHLYPHQQEGLEFLWENLAGTIKVSSLQKLDPRKGGGCIISHAPGTGKTLLTIVFLESFLKKFPRCCPVIVAPASMLLTWEAEFKKWRMGVPFINLNSSDLSSNEIVNGDIKRKKDLVRAMKIGSWSNGGSVLGVSYNLYEKLAGNTKNPSLEKMGNILLDVPGLVVLDEGHTPRNERSNIWNVVLKLKTKNRVILSGTPFQNNFRELFNTLRLVRPATATAIVNEKSFADMIQPKSGKKSRGCCRSGSEDIERLKAIISPFVHVHKGRILESKLPGLKRSVVLLNPPPFQKRFIENLENLSNNFEYEHKVALVSVHPSLLLQCSLSEKEVKLTDKKELEKVRLRPNLGVKTRFVIELIRLSISLNEKVLIFSQYIQPLELLKDQIALVFDWDDRREIMMIKGKIHQKARQTIINGFNDPKSEIKVLLASTKCCSEGIHLTGASRVVLLDVVWNPSVERQAISRAYRLGQEKMVYTYHLMAAGTTEEEKYDRQVAKGRLAELVFSSSAMAGDRKSGGGGGMEVNDKILKEMVDHQELKDMFKKIRYPEKET